MNVSAAELYARIARGDPTFLLDVRAAKEFERWRIEGLRPVEALNVPYTRILADADENDLPGAAAAYVAANLAGAIPRSSFVVTVCAKGGASASIADGLRSHGYDAANLEGGMIAWGSHYEIVPVVEERDLCVLQIARPARGCLSWMAIAGGEAVVIDPLRHVERYSEIASARGARIVAVVDTHAHADHLSGGRALAEIHGVPYSLHPFDAIHPVDLLPAPFGFRYLRDGAVIGGTRLRLEALHVPGHTLGCTALLLDRRVLFAGDTLFLESIARPDLGGKADAWTPLLRASLLRLLALGDDVVVAPGHFSRPGEGDGRGRYVSSLGAIRTHNDAARRALGDAAEFARHIQKTLPESPAQYLEIKRVNLALAGSDEARATELELGKNVCGLAMAPTA